MLFIGMICKLCILGNDGRV